MCEDKELDMMEEIPVVFTDEIELLEDRLADIVVAMGLPEEQTNAVLRLVGDALEDHHCNLLDALEDILGEQEEEGEQEA